MPIIDCYTLLGPWPQAQADLTVEALTAGMQARGVARSLVTHTTAVFYDSTLGNDQAIRLSREHGHLMPVGVVNPLRYPGCLDEIRRCLEAGVKVFRLCPREHGYPFSGSVGPLREVLAALEPARLLLVDLVGMAVPVLTPDLAELLPAPTAVTVDGESLGQAVQLARHAPNLWLETSRLSAGGAVEAAIRLVGSERVIFGSAAPLRALGSAVMSIQYAELTDADRTAVFEGNVQRALG